MNRSSIGRLRCRVLAVALAALTAAAGPPVALARAPRKQRSSNWAGYAVTTASGFASVAGTWTQPAVRCDQPIATYSAFWVGLGGFKQSSRALEQIGTDADCTADGHVAAYAWYELAPSPPVRLKLTIRRGDVLSAAVTVRGREVALRIRDLSTGAGVSKAVRPGAVDVSSAEWIAEAPSECVSANQCQPLPLTDFGSVKFTGATATSTGGHTGTITDPLFSCDR